MFNPRRQKLHTLAQLDFNSLLREFFLCGNQEDLTTEIAESTQRVQRIQPVIPSSFPWNQYRLERDLSRSKQIIQNFGPTVCLRHRFSGDRRPYILKKNALRSHYRVPQGDDFISQTIPMNFLFQFGPFRFIGCLFRGEAC